MINPRRDRVVDALFEEFDRIDERNQRIIADATAKGLMPDPLEVMKRHPELFGEYGPCHGEYLAVLRKRGLPNPSPL